MQEDLYDKTSPASIEKYAQLLIGKTFSQAIPNKTTFNTGKGKLGQFVEKYYFNYEPNSNPGPDFVEAGVELKVAPIKKLKSKNIYSPKERIVLNKIHYVNVVKENWDDCSLMKKNSLLLFIFYLYEENKNVLDYFIKNVHLWEFPENDLEIIKTDWETIVNKIKKGLAHELSEGETMYLGACTKASTSRDDTSQPFSPLPAKPRAFSLKGKYVKSILDRKLPENYEDLIKNSSELKNKSLEEIVIEKFKPYLGKSYLDLKKMFNLTYSEKSKHKYYLLSKAILGIKKDKISEFEKADIALKGIKLEKSGALKESMSFKNIDFNGIVKESEWEESEMYGLFSKKFLFVIFKFDENSVLKLEKVKFWNMSSSDLDICGQVWLDTKKRIQNNDYDNFIKIRNKKIAHVRPKGRDSKDLVTSPQGNQEKKKAYWLNSSYIKEIIDG
jgi:DNA mismatch repair protein MutH